MSKNGGLDQYGPERLGKLIFGTIRKKYGTERVKKENRGGVQRAVRLE